MSAKIIIFSYSTPYRGNGYQNRQWLASVEDGWLPLPIIFPHFFSHFHLGENMQAPHYSLFFFVFSIKDFHGSGGVITIREISLILLITGRIGIPKKRLS